MGEWRIAGRDQLPELLPLFYPVSDFKLAISDDSVLHILPHHEPDHSGLETIQPHIGLNDLIAYLSHAAFAEADLRVWIDRAYTDGLLDDDDETHRLLDDFIREHPDQAGFRPDESSARLYSLVEDDGDTVRLKKAGAQGRAAYAEKLNRRITELADENRSLREQLEAYRQKLVRRIEEKDDIADAVAGFLKTVYLSAGGQVSSLSRDPVERGFAMATFVMDRLDSMKKKTAAK